jgi:MFS family permease
VGAVVLFDGLFYGAISPLLPYYSQQFHFGKADAGVLTAAYAAGICLTAIPSGALAGKIGPRLTLVVGLGLTIASSVVFGFAHTIIVLDLARFFQGVGDAMSWSAGMAWLIQRSPTRARGQVIGATMTAGIIGSLLGPMIGTAAVSISPESVFVLAAALGVLLAAWSFAQVAPLEAQRSTMGTLLRALRDGRALLAMWLTGLGGVLSGTLSVLGALGLSRVGASSVVVGTAFLLGAAAAGFAIPVAGYLSDRLGWRLVVVIGLFCSAFMSLVLPLPTNVLPLFGAVVVATAAFKMSFPSAGAMISARADHTGLGQAYAFALFNLAWAGGQVLGSAGGAGLAQISSDSVVYASLAGLCLLTGFVILRPDGRVWISNS